jgi:flagellar biosynthesis/type III secretory pathway protein FliH
VIGEAVMLEEIAREADSTEIDNKDPMVRKLEEAYQSGYEDARATCMKQMEKQVAEQVQAFASMIDDLTSQRQRLVTDSEEAVVRLSCQIARRIVGKAVEIDEQIILQIVKNAVSRLADKQKLIIRVNPTDLATLNNHEPELLAATTGSTSVEVKEDNRIKRGGCLIEGESGNVEAQIERQIEVVERALVEAVR